MPYNSSGYAGFLYYTDFFLTFTLDVAHPLIWGFIQSKQFIICLNRQSSSGKYS